MMNDQVAPGTRWRGTPFIGAAFLLPCVALAVGYRLPNQDPQGIARGNAFVATADNPAAIYYNPAGISQLEGHNLQAGFYFVNANVDYRAPTGAETENEFEFQPVPQLYYTYSLKKAPLSFGLGVYAPYGLSLEYPEDSPLRTAAIRGKLLYATFNPIVAVRFHPTFSVGIGPTFNYSQVEFKRGLGGPVPNDYFKVDGDGFAPGFTAGLRWQPHEKWALGAKYHYRTTVDYEGDSEFYPYAPSTDTKASIRFPQFVTVGLSYRPTDNWNLEFNLDWTDWDNVNEIVFEGTPVSPAPVFPLQFTSSFMYEFGITRYLPKDYFLSLGYFYSENSSPDSTFNPIIPDANLHLGSVGFGRRGRRWDWSFAYHFAVGGRTVEDNVVNPVVNGEYDMFNQAFTVSARLKF